MTISKRIQSIRPSATLQITQRAAELRAAGVDVIGLGAGEPDFPTPEAPCAAAHAAIDAGRTRYTAVAGIPELREAVAEKFHRDQGLDCTAADVLVSTGAKQCLWNAVLALADPGQAVLAPAPYWVSYPAMCQLAGAEFVAVPTAPEHGFKVRPSDLDDALSDHPHARLFLFNSPGNPTGTVYDTAELRALGEVLARHPEVWVVTDEIYECLVYDGAEHVSLATACPELRPRTVLVNGLSKSFAMTGWRVGFAAGPRAAIAAMEKVQGHTTSNATSISQYAALAALRAGGDTVAVMRAAFARRRRLVLDAFAALPDTRLVPPQGAFYVFPDVSAWYGGEVRGSADLCRRILEEAQVALVPGDAFGDDRCVRLSYAAADDDLTRALARLHEFFARPRTGDTPG